MKRKPRTLVNVTTTWRTMVPDVFLCWTDPTSKRAYPSSMSATREVPATVQTVAAVMEGMVIPP